MNVIIAVLIKTLSGMAFQLLTSETLQELFVWGAEKLSKSTKTDVDDELVAIIKKHLNDKASI